MKKIISFILVLSMIASMTAVLVPSSAVTHGYIKGDANDDGEISMVDILLLRKYIAGIADDYAINTLASDCDENGEITNADFLYVRKIVAGLLDEEGNNTDAMYHVGRILIGDKAVNRYTIVTTDSNECMTYSARVLRQYIEEACGIRLDISANEKSVDTYKIVYRFDTEDKFSLGNDGYRVVLDGDGNVTIWCGAMRAPLYATYFFLEDIIGYRFLSGDNDRLKNSAVIYLYKNDTVRMCEGYDETEVPQFVYRAVAQGGCSSENFAPMRANASDGAGSGSGENPKFGWVLGCMFVHAHSYAYMDVITEGDPIRVYSTEENRMLNEAYRTQPCLTDESFYEKAVSYNIRCTLQKESWGQYLGKHYTQISCSPNDNTDFCTCSTCKTVYAAEGSISGTVFRLANRMAEVMEEFRPGMEVYTIAYWDARRPPKMTIPRDNVCVCFCIGGCNNHTYDDTASCAANGGNPRLNVKNWDGTSSKSSNVDDMNFFKGWAELTNNIYIWYYSANFNFYMAPSPNIFNIFNDFREIASIGAIGIYSEGSSSARCSFEYLRAYLVSRMMWNPYMTEEEYNNHINEYLMIYYGPGWQYIRQYLDMSNYASDLQGCWTNNFDYPFEMYNEQYFADHYFEMSDLFDNASAMAENSDQTRRINLLRTHFDWLGLSAIYESNYANGTASQKAVYVEKYKHLYNTVVSEDISISSFGSGKYGCENFPKTSDIIMSPTRWLWEDCTGYWN